MSARKNATTKAAPLTARVLRKAAAKATSEAHKRAFEHVRTLLVARDGWLVRVDRDGNVVEKIKALGVAADAVPSSGTDG